jgi:histidinol phosphatase-like enzyme
MILKAARDLSIDIKASLMVGDKASDRIVLAQFRSVIVKSKYMPEGYDVETLEDVEKIL